MKNPILSTKIYLNIKAFNSQKRRTLTNNSSSYKHLIITIPRHTKKTPVMIDSVIETHSGEDCTIKLLDQRLRTIKAVRQNSSLYLDNPTKIFFIGISIPPRSRHTAKSVTISQDQSIIGNLQKALNGDHLILLPSQPSDNSLERASLDSYIKHLTKQGISSRVAVIDSTLQEESEVHHQSEDLSQATMCYNHLRQLLQIKSYSFLSVLWFDEKITQVLDASDLTKSRLLLFPRKVDITRSINPYFEKITDGNISDELTQSIHKYAAKECCHWLFKEVAYLKMAEHRYGVSFSNSTIFNIYDLLPIKTQQRNKKSTIEKSVIDSFANDTDNQVDLTIHAILQNKQDFNFSVLYEPKEKSSPLLKPLRSLSGVQVNEIRHPLKQISDIDLAIFAKRNKNDFCSDYYHALARSGAAIITIKNPGDLATKLSSVSRDTFIKAHSLALQEQRNGTERTKLLDKIFKMPPPSLERFKLHDVNTPDKPLLTIAIPAYNCEKFLVNSVLSLVDHKLAGQLEVLIINDGSKDNTVKIADSIIQNIDPHSSAPIIKLIDKENGGHGSTINVGIKEARGKYFRLMDGDDYFYTKNLLELLKLLTDESSDIILTDYTEDFAITCSKNNVHLYDFMRPGVQYNLDDFVQHPGFGFDKWGPMLPTSTVKTSLLKEADFLIDEHAFYVDMEFNFITYVCAKTIRYRPLNIYNYYLGRPGQSMSKESLIRNVYHHEKVTLRLLSEFHERIDNIPQNKRDYLVDIIIKPMCKMQYMITTEYFNNRKPFLSFDTKLKKYPLFYNDTSIAGKQIRLHRLNKGRHIFADKRIKSTAKHIKRLIKHQEV